MEPGSTVELVNDSWNESSKSINVNQGIVYPVLGKLYIVRDNLEDAIRLQEIVNPTVLYSTGPDEIAFYKWRFRELLPPLELSLEEIFNAEEV